MTPKAWRESKGLDVYEAAKVLGTDPQTVKKIEGGEGVGTTRLAERFVLATEGAVPLVEWLYPAGTPTRIPITEADAAPKVEPVA